MDSCSCGRGQWFSHTSRAEMRESSWGLTCGAPGCSFKVPVRSQNIYFLFIYLFKKKESDNLSGLP